MLKNPISERKIDVLYLGRLVHGKGVEKLIDSIHLLRSQRSKINFLIIGNGILETYVKQKIGAMDGVLFSNWVSHDLVPTILNDTKLLILPSETEGVPNIVIEALACGTPVVATPVGGIAGVVLPGKTGWLLSDNSPGAIARTLEEALNCPDLSAMSERAARFAREQYSFEAARRRLGRALKTMRL
jgi:glycosyltransferase involved in cell wall biosynthesis